MIICCFGDENLKAFYQSNLNTCKYYLALSEKTSLLPNGQLDGMPLAHGFFKEQLDILKTFDCKQQSCFCHCFNTIFHAIVSYRLYDINRMIFFVKQKMCHLT